MKTYRGMTGYYYHQTHGDGLVESSHKATAIKRARAAAQREGINVEVVSPAGYVIGEVTHVF